MTLYYFDHAASAPRRDEVAEAMAPYLHGVVGNPSGTHRAARDARRAIEEARDEIAELCGLAPGGVIFTAGGTESCHLAISGVVHRARRGGPVSILTSAVEHHAVLGTAEQLAADDADVEHLTIRVDADGVVQLDAVGELLSERTALVSVMVANNETGVIQPVNAIAELVREHSSRVVTHCDAVAGAPWLDLADETASVDLVSICAHKLGGPVNSGALLVRGGVVIDPVISGGGQERGRRGGTVDVAAAVGLAAALRACARERVAMATATHVRQARMAHALGALAGVAVTAPHARKLPGHVHVTVEGCASDELLFLLDQAGVCASAASSCSSGAGLASHVLHAMGVRASAARGAVRFTFGTETSDADIDAVVTIFTRALDRVRADQ